ncbi:MAG: cytochrome P450 [Chloroflexi bacterium]|nr:cytochrome P450 [Chloroflexota bacterium]
MTATRPPGRSPRQLLYGSARRSTPLVRRAILPIAVRGLLLRERMQSGVTWNPLDRRYHQDPTPFYARLRERDPVHRSALMRGWVLSLFEDIDETLRDHERFSSDLRKSPVAQDSARRGGPQLEPSMLVMDPPDHTRLRSLVARAFTRSAIEAWRPRVEQRVDELLDAAERQGTFDVMEALANPLPVLVIAEMLGVPPSDYAMFKQKSDAVARLLEPTSTRSESHGAVEARADLTRYLDEIATERRGAPREDLLSVLLAAEEAGDRLTHQELLVTLRLLLVAGNETTTNLIGNGLLALLRHPDQLAWLRAHPERVDDAVEELLRFDSPVQLDQRTALTDVEIGGRPVAAGEQVVMLLGAANRDPARFQDPDRLDLSRGDKSHLAFGRGIHHCLGAPLARMEGQVVFAKLVERFPSLRLADPAPRFKDHVVLRGLRALPVSV